MKSWNKEVFGKCIWIKGAITKKIDVKDLKEAENSLTNEEIEERKGWKNKIGHLNLLEGKRRQQKMKMKWLKKVKQVLNGRRRSFFIWEPIWRQSHRQRVFKLIYDSINHHSALELERPFEMEEIRKAIIEVEGCKFLYHRFWMEFIKKRRDCQEMISFDF